jgi:hypothetical protein
MKIRPKLAFSLAGQHGPRLDSKKVYPCIPAWNQPDREAKGKIFVPFNPTDIDVEYASILLERDDYEIITE